METSTNTSQSSNLDLSFSLGNKQKQTNKRCFFSLRLLPGTFQASQLFLISKQDYLLQEVLNEDPFRTANKYEHRLLE